MPPRTHPRQVTWARVRYQRAHVAPGVVRYPVKSMGGERSARRCRAGRHPGRPRGARRGPRGRVVTSIRAASLAAPRHARSGRRAAGGRSPLGDPRGRPRRRGGGRTGLPARGRRRARALRRAAAAGRHRRRIHALGYDPRRFRPNLLSAESKDSPSGHGRASCSTSARRSSASSDLRQRCIMTTFDPDTAEQDPRSCCAFIASLDGLLALNCEVPSPDRIRVGDTATITHRGTREVGDRGHLMSPGPSSSRRSTGSDSPT